jgi:hypothetical protein
MSPLLQQSIPCATHSGAQRGNVALGDFVRFSQAIVCSHGGPEDAKQDDDRSRFMIRAWFGQCLLYSEDDEGAR